MTGAVTGSVTDSRAGSGNASRDDPGNGSGTNSCHGAQSQVPTATQQASPDAYPRSRRLVKTDEFSSVFRLRPVRRSAHFVLYARPNGLEQARLGVVAGKRFAPRAVTRNTVKRIARELFRQMRLPPADLVLRLSAALTAKSQPATTRALKQTLRHELSTLLSSQQQRESSP